MSLETRLANTCSQDMFQYPSCKHARVSLTPHSQSRDISSTDATDFSAANRAEAVDRGIARKKVGKVKEVEIQIDIIHDDYTFTTQPGALKRVSNYAITAICT